MIYSHKPQRSGRSITSNTNNPPQDPPPPPIDKSIELDDALLVPDTQIPDVLIEDSTPPVMDTPISKINKAPKIVKPIQVKKTPKKKTSKKIVPVVKSTITKFTWRHKIVSFLKKLFRLS